MIQKCFILFLLWGCSKSIPLSKSFPAVNVKDFGAVGNGIQDDTHAFDLAMDKADSLKLPVYIPIGIYKIHLLLSHDNLQVIGEKQPDENVTDGTVILGEINCNYKKNIKISNLGIDSRNQLGPTDDAALTSGANAGRAVLNQQFSNISIIGDGYYAYKHGILCQAGTGISIKNVTVSLFYHGIAMQSGNSSLDSIYANYCGYTAIVVKSDHGDNILTENVSINHVTIKGNPSNSGGTILVTSFGDTASITRNITIQNVYSNYGGEACVMIQKVQGSVYNVIVKDCVAENQGDLNTRACYDVDGGTDILFSNCTANNSSGYGFRSSGNSTNVKVINSFEKKSKAGSWTGNFKYLQLNGIEIIR